MLSSITPLGERGRGFSWRFTAAAFIVGATVAGGAAGWLAGAVGSVLPSAGSWQSTAALAVVITTLMFDASPLRRWLRTTRRQVNEDWLTRYRGWVYGLAFGAQLGVGVITIVTSAATYGAAVLAVVCGSAAGGLIIGGLFGALRGLSILPARAVTSPSSLTVLHRSLIARERSVRALTRVAEGSVAVLALRAWG